MNITFTVKLSCSGGECCRRYLHTKETVDPAELPRLAQQLVLMAKADGWTLDGNAIFCPECVRSVRPDLKASVRESRQRGEGRRREMSAQPARKSIQQTSLRDYFAQSSADTFILSYLPAEVNRKTAKTPIKGGV